MTNEKNYLKMDEYIVYSKLSHNDEWTETYCYNIDDIHEEMHYKLSFNLIVNPNDNAISLLGECN
jgi:hypothetical protein